MSRGRARTLLLVAPLVACGDDRAAPAPEVAPDAVAARPDAAIAPPAPDASVGDDETLYLLQTEVVRDLYLDIPAESWSAIDAESSGWTPNRSYHPASLTFEGVTYEGVGLRTRGGPGSSRSLAGKASWRVSLEWDDPAVAGCPAPRRLHGLKTLNLLNSMQDPSFVREHLANTYLRAVGVPAPRAGYVNVHVRSLTTGEYDLWGLYVLLEPLNKAFLARWFDSNDGNLFEATLWQDVTNPEGFEAPAPPGPCDDPDPIDGATMASFLSSMEAAQTFYPNAGTILHFDRFLSLWAAVNISGNRDCYVDDRQNYRLYHDPSDGRWTMIQTGTGTSLRDYVDYDFSILRGDAYLVERCKAEPACLSAYGAHARTALSTFADLGLSAEAQRIRDLIRPSIEADPRKEYMDESAGNFDPAAPMATYDEDFARLRAWIEGRPAEVEAELDALGY